MSMASKGTTVLEARGLRKTFHADGVIVRAVRGVDLSVDRGEFVAVMGPRAAESRR